MIDDYTRILEKAAESEDPKVAESSVRRLLAHLRSAGRLKILPSIAYELRKIKARRQALSARVEIATKEEEARALSEAKEAGIEVMHATVNKTLISGWRAMKGGILIDRTGKRALVDIYKKVIS